jgi:tetratricopeptide (TPR) repeat protein
MPDEHPESFKRPRISTPGFLQRDAWPLTACLLIAALAIACQYPSLHAPFVREDMDRFAQNPQTHLEQKDRAKLPGFLTGPRPLTMASFAVNHILGGPGTTGYHAVNITVHALSGIFLFLCLLALLSSPGLAGIYKARRLFAFAGAALWAANPVQTQAVAQVSQRVLSMQAMFVILAVLLYARARLSGGALTKAALFTGTALAGTAALLTRETAVILPALLWLHEAFFVQNLSSRWLRRWSWLFPVCLAAPAALVFLVRSGAFSPWTSLFYPPDGMSGITRFLTGFRVLWVVFGLFLYPHPSRLSLDHAVFPSRSLLDPATTLPAVLATVLLLSLAVVHAREKKIFSFAVFWFVTALALDALLLPLDLAIEPFAYLPSMMAAPALVLLAGRIFRARASRFVLLCLGLAVLIPWSAIRSSIYRVPSMLLRDSVYKEPFIPRPHYSLGTALLRQGAVSGKTKREALKELERALALDPKYPGAHESLGIALAEAGRSAEAEARFREALEIRPTPGARTSLASMLAAQGRLDEALLEYKRAIGQEPGFVQAYASAARVLSRMNRQEEAFDLLEKAIALSPEDPGVNSDYGTALLRLGKREAAVRQFERLVRLAPGSPDALSSLGQALAFNGRPREAEEALKKALAIAPRHFLANSSLGLLLAGGGDYARALPYLEAAAHINPRDAEALNNLAAVLAKLGRYEEALAYFEKAQEKSPEDSNIRAQIALVRHMLGRE